MMLIKNYKIRTNIIFLFFIISIFTLSIIFSKLIVPLIVILLYFCIKKYNKILLINFLFIFILINFWMIISIPTSLFYGDLNINLFKIIIISFSYFYGVSIIVLNKKAEYNLILNNIQNVVVAAILIMAVYYFFYENKLIDQLYANNINISENATILYDDFLALMGVGIFAISQKNVRASKIDIASLIFILIASFFMGSRTLLLYSFFIFLAIIYIINFKIFFILTPLITLFFILQNIFFDSTFNFGKSVERLINSQSDLFENQGRLALYNDFINRIEVNQFLVGNGHSIIENTTEGVTSFHSYLLDSLWFSGLIGFLPLIYGLILLLIYLYKSNIINKINYIFIIFGIIFAAPPFSNIAAINLCLPLILFTTISSIKIKSSHK